MARQLKDRANYLPQGLRSQKSRDRGWKYFQRLMFPQDPTAGAAPPTGLVPIPVLQESFAGTWVTREVWGLFGKQSDDLADFWRKTLSKTLRSVHTKIQSLHGIRFSRNETQTSTYSEVPTRDLAGAGSEGTFNAQRP